jgi:hypothetical protein
VNQLAGPDTVTLLITHGREATMARLGELAMAEVQALSGILAHPESVRIYSVGVDWADPHLPVQRAGARN